jgi:hypothetical protein
LPVVESALSNPLPPSRGILRLEGPGSRPLPDPSRVDRPPRID